MRFIELHIETQNYDRAIEFYTELLPHEKVIRDDDQTFIILPDGSAFGIWRKGHHGLYDGLAADHLHFALQIRPDEYNEYKSRLELLGREVTEHNWPDGHRSLYFFDMDGHQGEFMTKNWLGQSS